MGFGALTFLFTVWAGVAILGGIYDATGTDTTYFTTLTQFDIFRESQIDLLLFDFTFPVPNFAWFKALGNVMIWNSSLFNGWANYLRVTLLLALTFGMVGSIITSLFGNRLSR